MIEKTMIPSYSKNESYSCIEHKDTLEELLLNQNQIEYQALLGAGLSEISKKYDENKCFEKRNSAIR